MQPTEGDVHVNRPLTNMSVAFIQDAAAFIADQVFQNIPVQKQSDAYWSYDIAPWTRDEMQIRAPGTPTVGSGWKVDADHTYYAHIWGIHHDIPDAVRANSDDPINLDRETTLFVTQKALIRREKLWAASFFRAGIWSYSYAGVNAGPIGNQVLQWDDANSIPITDVKNAKRAVLELTGFKPNMLILGSAVKDALTDHPDFVDRVKYGQTPGAPAQVNLQAMAALFEVDKILVMEATETTSKENAATRTAAFIGGKKALLVYVPPAPGLMTPAAGYTFSWVGYLGAGPAGNRIKRFRMEELASDRVELEMAFAQKLICADLGAFWDTVVA